MHENKLSMDHCYSDHFLYTAQDRTERCEDLEELHWLIQDLYMKFPFLKDDAADLDEFANIRKYMKSCLSQIENKLEDVLFTQFCNLTDFLKIKYEIRKFLKQACGLITSLDWQSPSFTKSHVKESGPTQKELLTYMRTHGSPFISKVEQSWSDAFYEMSPACKQRSWGQLTNSGMKALEVALVTYRVFTKEALPIYYHKGLYYEAISMITRFHPESKALHVQDIYQKIEKNESMGCLVIDPGTSWPVSEGIDLDRLFTGLMNHRQEQPFFIIIDRTLMNLTVPLFEKYGDALPKHVVLVTCETLIKHFQYGLDLANMGFLMLSGSIIKYDIYRDVIKDVMRILSGIPDPSLVWRVPSANRIRMDKRMQRMARNANIIRTFMIGLQDLGYVQETYSAISPSKNLKWGNELWIGSLVYIQIPFLKTFEQYDKFTFNLVENAPAHLHLHYGTSFGFDTMRLCVLEDFSDKHNPNCALRISAGRETETELLMKLNYLSQQLEKGVDEYSKDRFS